MKSDYHLKAGDCFYGPSPGLIRVKLLSGILISIFIQNQDKIGIIYIEEDCQSLVMDKLKSIIQRIKSQKISPNNVMIKCLSLQLSSYQEVTNYIKRLGVQNEIKQLSMNNLNIVIETNRKQIYIDKKVQSKKVKIQKIEIEKVEIEKVESKKDNKTLKILIVDDSSTMRKVLKEMLKNSNRISHIYEAIDAREAEQIIKSTPPDVITLDINMPGMDGVTFLKKYIKDHPIPTIMITSFNINDSGHIMEALEAGAFDYIEKPSFSEIKNHQSQFLEIIYSAYEAKDKIKKDANAVSSKVPQTLKKGDIHKYLLAIGASTGGTEALKKVLTGLPSTIPPTLIVQHIPPVFSKAFADRMNELCPFIVKEAQDGDLVEPNKVIIAQGGRHLKLIEGHGNLVVKLSDEPPVNRFRPSVDYLFNSIVQLQPNKHIIAAILTGMGDDGAKGLLNLKKIGAYTIAQDEQSSVVFGMPKAAIEINAHCKIETLDKIAGVIVKTIAEGTKNCLISKSKRND